MIDVARSKGLTIDMAQLSERLGVPVVEVQANRGIGVDELKTPAGRGGRIAARRSAGEPVSQGISSERRRARGPAR